MITTLKAIEIIAVVAVVTFFTRGAPFVFFSGKNGVPMIVRYLGNVLPSAIITALIVFCVKDVTFTESPYGAPYLAAIAITALLHILFKKTLVSILGGTVAFMLLSRVIFA